MLEAEPSLTPDRLEDLLVATARPLAAEGNLLTGEQTVVGGFDRDAWLGSTWTGSTWTGSTWTGSTWTGSTWTGSTWTNVRWDE